MQDELCRWLKVAGGFNVWLEIFEKLGSLIGPTVFNPFAGHSSE